MTEVTLESISEQLKRILIEVHELKSDVMDLKTRLEVRSAFLVTQTAMLNNKLDRFEQRMEPQP
jgi:hypothetical protein